MAMQLHLGKHWFHKDHYDLPVNRRIEIEKHCLSVPPRTIVRLIRAHNKLQVEMKMPGLTATKRGVRWSENMDHEAILYEYYKAKGATKLHYCPDWDYMAIHDESSEFDACTCEDL